MYVYVCMYTLYICIGILRTIYTILYCIVCVLLLNHHPCSDDAFPPLLPSSPSLTLSLSPHLPHHQVLHPGSTLAPPTQFLGVSLAQSLPSTPDNPIPPACPNNTQIFAELTVLGEKGQKVSDSDRTLDQKVFGLTFHTHTHAPPGTIPQLASPPSHITP